MLMYKRDYSLSLAHQKYKSWLQVLVWLSISSSFSLLPPLSMCLSSLEIRWCLLRRLRTISSGGRRGENFPFFARCAPFFSRSLSFDQIWLYFDDLSRNQDGLNYNFDYSPRRGFGFFNCASFTLTKLAVAGLSSKGLSSNKNYQKNLSLEGAVIYIIF